MSVTRLNIGRQSNQHFDESSDGFIIGGGTTQRDLTLTGGDVTLTGSGSNTYTFPSSADTLVGRSSTDTLTNKIIAINKATVENGVLDVNGDIYSNGEKLQDLIADAAPKFYQNVYTLASSGSGSITDVPFAPRAIMVHSFVHSSASSFSSISSMGFASISGSTITESSDGHGITDTPVVGGRSTSTAAFLRVSGSGTFTYRASVTSFNSDGLSYSVSTSDGTSSNRTFSVLFMG